jgi:hypothetical protein
MRFALIGVVGLLLGTACAYVAQRRGKDPLLWFLLGAVLNVIALLLLLVLRYEPNGKRR